ncbi:reverse transcriptase family protein [Ilyonectria robusta]
MAFLSSRAPRPIQAADADLWHRRLGHLNPDALDQLVMTTQGTRIKGPTTINCKACSLGKAERQVSRRRPKTTAKRPFYRIFLDLFALGPSFEGYITALPIKDQFTGIIMLFLLRSAIQEAILDALDSFEIRIKR